MQPVDDRGRAVEKLLAGRYEVIGFLGRGGFAAVYKVKSASLQRFEALKVLHESHGEDSDFARRFRQESRVAASLEHPSIVKIYDFGHVQGMLWYSMQFVDGPTLNGELDKRRTFDEESTARIAMPLLDALDYSHARGIIHRDIKPDNVLLDQRGRPFLMDFGIAKTGDNLVKTQTGFILGSPAYLSPEQLRGQPLDGRTDVYSLGATLYQMLAGVVPFRTESMSALARRLTEDAPPLSGRRAGVHPELERIVHKSLARDRNARYRDAAEMRDDLDAFLAEVYPRAARTRASNELPGFGPTAATPAAPLAPPSPSAAALAASRAMLPDQPSSPVSSDTASTRTSSTRAEEVRPASRMASRPRWLWPAAGALVVVAAAIAAWVLTRGRAPESVLPAPGPRATAVPMAVPTAVPTPAPAQVVPPAPGIPVLPSPQPSLEAGPAPTSRGPARETSARAPVATRVPAPARAEARAPALRRAKTQPSLEEEAPLTLSPEQQRACGGKVVGISVVVAEDGSLKNKHVISPVSPECDAIALEAISRNRYRPGLDEEGRPIEVRFLLSFPF